MNTTATNQSKIREALNGNDSVMPACRIYALSLAGYTQAQLAREADVTPAAVNRVIHNTLDSYNIASCIAVALSVPLSKLWPDGRYSKPQQDQAA